ncbi:MAG: TonB-dependent receptor [Pseudomonadota bacterium]
MSATNVNRPIFGTKAWGASPLRANFPLVTSLLFLWCMFALSGPALGQGLPGDNDTLDDLVGDDIVVTARRTEEVLEDVPGSVIVLGSEEIEQSNIRNGTDVVLRLPNVNFNENSNPADLDISIRGISNLLGGNAASGPTNGVFADGVLLNPTGSAIGVNPNLFDLERVEVAYGPQGTAFGRGTIGGAINFVTKAPTDELEFEVSAGVGSFPSGEARAVANIPILEDGLLSARIVAFGEISDGFLDLSSIGEDNQLAEYGARISLRSEPTDNLTLDFSASFDRSVYDAANSSLLTSAEDGDPSSPIDFIEEDVLERILFTASGAYEVEFGTFSSRTSYLDISLDGIDDSDATALDIITTAIDSEDRSIAQEFRFESKEFALPSDLGTISFNPGVSFSFNDSQNDFLVGTGADFFTAVTTFGAGAGIIPPGTLVLDDGSFGAVNSDQQVNTFGVFGDVRWRPVDELEITVGGRFTRDKVRVSSEAIGTGLLATSTGLLQVPTPFGPVTIPFVSPLPAIFPPTAFIEAEESFTAFTPNASILYEWNEDLSTYLSFSTGFRAGGFSATGGALVPFDEETVRSFEAGFRASFLDEQLQVRGSGFFLDYDDIQVTSTTSIVGITVIDNAASARSVGAELGFTARPLDGLTFNADWGLTFAKFTDYQTSPFGDLTGNTLPNAPRHTLALAVDYQHPLGLLLGNQANGFVRSEFNYTSGFSNLIDPTAMTFDGHNILNFRAGLRADEFEIEAFVENALNDAIIAGSVSGIADFLLGDVPTVVDISGSREFGVRARVKF